MTPSAWFALLAACLLAAADGPAGAQPGTVAPSRLGSIVALADGLWLLPGRFERGSQPDGNSLLLEGADGIVVVDSGRHAGHAQALLDFARQRGKPLLAVVNTHWHLDHLGGNALLRDATPGLQVHASRAVQDAVTQRMPGFEADLQGMLKDPATDADTRRMVEIDLALYARRAAMLPDVIVEPVPRDLTLGGRALRLGVLRGVSGGDVWLLDRSSGTLAVGDFVTLPVPFFDTACTEQWRQAMGQIELLSFERVVPGHGPVMTRAEFRRYRGALDNLLGCAAGDSTAEQCSAGWQSDLGSLLPAGSDRVVRGMLAHYIGQRLRAPAAERDRFCVG